MLRKRFFLTIIAALCGVLPAVPAAAAERDQVLVIGALHGLHEKETSFDFTALELAIRRAKPDVIVLEVREDELETRGNTPGRPEYPKVVWKLLSELGATAIPMEPSGPAFERLSQVATTEFQEFARRDPAGSKRLTELEASIEAALLSHWQHPRDAQDQLTGNLSQVLTQAQAALIGTRFAAVQKEWDDIMIQRAREAMRANPGKRVLILASYRNRAALETALAAEAPDRVVLAGAWMQTHLVGRSKSQFDPDSATDQRNTMTKTLSAEHGLATARPTHSGHIAANGVNYYYEVRGEGAPLLLLHGGLSSMDAFTTMIPELAPGRKIITVDLQGHGRTALGDRPFDIAMMGEDIATIVRTLKLGPTDIVGYSMGAGVAFRFAARHPSLVRRLVLVSAGLATDAFYPEILESQAGFGSAVAPMLKDTPLYSAYAAVAPRPDEFPRLLDAMGAAMRQRYDWSDEVTKLTMPVMLVYGDSDMYRPESMIDFYKRLGGGLRDGGWQGEGMSRNRLAILPGATHYNILMSPELVQAVRPFLEQP